MVNLKEWDVSATLGFKLEINDNNDAVSMTHPFLIHHMIDSHGSLVINKNKKDKPAVFSLTRIHMAHHHGKRH